MYALPSGAFRGDQRPARDDGVWISGERLRPNNTDTIAWEATTEMVPQITLTRDVQVYITAKKNLSRKARIRHHGHAARFPSLSQSAV